MIEYLKQIAARLQQAADAHSGRGAQQSQGEAPPNAVSLFEAFSEELYRLDPRDFDPIVRAGFVEQRAEIRRIARGGATSDEIRARYARNILPLLESYLGEGTGAVTRDFSFVQDADVRRIIERDYKELRTRAFPDGAWKSTVVLSGGILEAILYDRLSQNPAAAMGAARAPRRRGGVIKDITLHNRANEWTLSDLIKVASDLNIISQSNEDSVDEVLREYRNYVHPRVEVQKGVSISEGHAMASLGSLEVIIDKLQ